MSNVAITPVVYEYRCKICTMARSHPELYKDLHFQVLELGTSMARAMAYINRKIDDEGHNVPKLNNQNLSAHFTNHISLPDRVNAELTKQPQGGQTLRDVNPEVSYFVEDLVRRKIGNEVNDYLNLDQLRAQLMEKLEMMEEIVGKTDEDGKSFVDLEAMDRYIHIVKEIRGLIVDLNKIRSSKQLMNMVIKSLIERSTFDMVQKLSREYDQERKDMQEFGIDQVLINRLDTNRRMKLAEIVATTARAAVESVTKAYKLH